MNIDIPSLFPHEHPFLLVDRIDEIGDDHAVAFKLVTRTEPWFTGHFPGDAILPGVILLEAMAQTGRFLESLDAKLISSRLARIDDVVFRRAVRPGDAVRMRADRIGGLGSLTKFRVVADVEGDTVAEAEFLVHAELSAPDEPRGEATAAEHATVGAR